MYEETFFRCRTAPPTTDLKEERRNGEFVRRAIAAGLVRACHDLADGGLLAAAAEMIGEVGLKLRVPPRIPPHRWLLAKNRGATCSPPPTTHASPPWPGNPGLRWPRWGKATV